uniref:C3H1-type domain-containing protein n=1 Tax=Elaeophora elaphi TaxID=1147741 RepID=A0A0R3S416_9BILA
MVKADFTLNVMSNYLGNNRNAKLDFYSKNIIMPPIAAARSSQNIRRTCKLMNDISTSPTAATTKTPPAACASGKNVQAVTPSHPKNSKLYKTELCRTWMDCGRCNYGDKYNYEDWREG